MWDRKRIFKLFLTTVFMGAFIALFAPFWGEILLAAVFAFAMEPQLGRWLQPRHLRWRASVALILLGMFVLLAVPVTFAAYKTYATIMEVSKSGFQNTEFFQKMMSLRDQLVNLTNSLAARVGFADRFDLGALSEDRLGMFANSAMAFTMGMVYQVPIALLSVFIFCAALYFFLAEAAVLKRIFYRQDLLNPHEADRFIEVLQRASYGTVVTSMVIGVIQATIVSVGALIFDAGDFTVVFVLTFFCSFIPVIGAGPVALALGLYKLLLGDVGDFIGLLVVSIVAGTTDNLVRPILISSAQEDLHPIVSLLAIIGALVIFGMPGLFLGPVIASVAVRIIPTLYAGPQVGAGEIVRKETP
ncbi:MAG TPA: AI-2E family transporter [Bdellovibrionales bacterium]|nr:AI-2E family transporter [Bdellovibrionales bacterium]